jgi:hypothetical protein
MNLPIRVLLRRDFFSFAHKAIRELEGTKLGDELYLRYLARELNQFAGGTLVVSSSICRPATLRRY